MHMKLIKSKKGQFGTWFDYVFAIGVGFLIFFLLFYLTYRASTTVEKEVAAKTESLKSDITLLSCLRTPLAEMPQGSLYTEATLADLLNIIETEKDNGRKEQYKNMFIERMAFMLDGAYGAEKWKVSVSMADDSFEFGKTSGEAHVSSAEMPSIKGGTIKISLLSSGPGDELQEKLEPAK